MGIKRSKHKAKSKKRSKHKAKSKMSNENIWGICKECYQKNTEWRWCNACNAKHFQQNFKKWTSGNDDIDKFIQHTQLSANDRYGVLEWIPYDKFYDIEFIAKGGFGKVYRAKWIDSYIRSWDNENKNWNREGL